MTIEALRLANPGLVIFGIDDPAFKPYGEPVPGDWAAMVRALEEHAPVPEAGVAYVASHPPLEASPDAALIRGLVFGGTDVQIGYCSGRNATMNGLEYHKASEMLVAADDLVLFLALRGQLAAGPNGPSIDSGAAMGLFVRRAQAVELYSGTMHLAPCRLSAAGFRAAIVLPRGTNEAYEGAIPAGDPLLRKKNKWILAHPERKPLIDQGVLPLLGGPNRELKLPEGVA